VKIINATAPNITPISLELGGKDAAIVLPDAPVERTARAIVWGAFTNAGQACASIERLYVVRGGNSELLVNRIVQLVNQLKVGDPLLETTEIGPLIDVQQFDHVVNLVEQAVSAGAEILSGGEKISSPELRDKGLEGYFYRPTVLLNVDHNMRIMQEETFGPALPIMMVDSAEEAVRLANESTYALAASVWSANLTRAQSIANKIQAGTVFINDCLYSHAVAELPWGGLKKSGFGRSHSSFGLLDLVNIKHISVDEMSWFSRLWWYPYHSAKMKTVRYGLDYMYGKDHKLASLRGFITNLFKFKSK
jgi:succinate-semialdehyde dehydrogenase / glutarate-semialdehyde dehydrogenase